ncbi:hypothetical protein HOD83_00740 [Candidatus Woesearchaeota archaeon]|jgi:hypothetical protein|nr:hypothetical protein [Candidatus Woesearchaeota archaeon]MBT4114043.1 hypothetical protein [Candidatus Woesearchaeota archaeon]MBT4248100.1 hypothetical protein [Candidatus Woesearchaeota archaeon]
MAKVRFIKYGVKNAKGFKYTNINKASVQAVSKPIYEPEFFEETYGEEIYAKYSPPPDFLISIT